MKITPNPFESHVYHVSGLGVLPLSEDVKPLANWLELQNKAHWKMEGPGMIRINPPLETFFILKWL